jgi:Zn-dependent peptidase ImmA (M78 family)/transcriptional regulator with XRE-family HTH domain
VRGRVQIAPFSSAKNATGHRLTPFEARDAYGQLILDEAREYGSAVLAAAPNAAGLALRQRREALGLSAERAEQLIHLPVAQAESGTDTVGVNTLEKIAMRIGLDERLLAFDLDAGADKNLGVRLRTLHAEPPQVDAQIRLSDSAVLAFAESASLIRIQNRLTRWLRFPVRWTEFDQSSDYGYATYPAFRVGYDLAEQARGALELGDQPISSMRELVEDALGIPVIQRALTESIAGATVSNGSDRGVVLNAVGANQLVWIRRSTLAHELGHLLFDPAQSMQSIRVDLYDANELNPETARFQDFVEQRANAFAIAFLAPPAAVRELVQPPFTADGVVAVMETFGISATAAHYHLSNTYHRQYDVPWIKRTVKETPLSRRGRFAGLVAESFRKGLITSETASLYLNCAEEDFKHSVTAILQFFPIS